MYLNFFMEINDSINKSKYNRDLKFNRFEKLQLHGQ